MNRGLNLGKLAAISGFTAVAALLTGLGSAGADELSDLRANQQALTANQQLLQQRIDQLAAAANNNPEQQAAVTPGQVVAGAPSLAGSFPRSFLIPGTNTSLAITGYVKYDMQEYITGGSTGVGSGVNEIYGLPGTAGAALNLKGPPGSITAPPPIIKRSGITGSSTTPPPSCVSASRPAPRPTLVR